MLSRRMFLAACSPCLSPAQTAHAVRFGLLLDGRGAALPDATVLIRGDRVEDVLAKGRPAPSGYRQIDLRRFTGLPGLIDVHTHMTYTSIPKPGGGQWPPAARLVLAGENARKTLATGVTTVRDLNAAGGLSIAMRDLILAGRMQGPRMFVCGAGILSLKATRGRRNDQTAEGPAEVEALVRRQIAEGADFIKMFASTGSGPDVTGDPTFSFEEIRAAVDAAHALGRKITIHTYGPAAARDALRARADSIEHAVDLDDETLEGMAKQGVFYVPTIDHNRYYSDIAPEQKNWPAGVQTAFQQFIERNVETARRAHRKGVRLAMGSDALNSMFGQNTRELAWLVKAGLTPEQALATATTNAAAMLGLESDLGCVTRGAFADLIAVDGDPRKNIDAVIRGVKWVMKGGDVIVPLPNA